MYSYIQILGGGIINKNIFITVDVEGDWSLYPSEQKTFAVEPILRNLDSLDRIIKEAESLFQTKIPITWFIRCDASVKNNLGSYDGLLNSMERFLEMRIIEKDCFGIHPHLYSTNEDNSQKISADDIEVQLSLAFQSWKSYFGENARFSRLGEARMTNHIANQLSQNGVELDSTALPGRSRKDNGFDFDWSRATEFPYYPSKHDYQIMGEGSTNHAFLEVPFTMLPIKGSNDSKVIHRYFNLSYRSNLIEEALLNMSLPENIICVLHPHEIFPKKDSVHDIISYKPDSFLNNLTLLNKLSETINFKTLDQFKL